MEGWLVSWSSIESEVIQCFWPDLGLGYTWGPLFCPSSMNTYLLSPYSSRYWGYKVGVTFVLKDHQITLKGAETDINTLAVRWAPREWEWEGETNTAWFLLWPLSKLCESEGGGSSLWEALICPNLVSRTRTQSLVWTGVALLMFRMWSLLLCFMYPCSVLFFPSVPCVDFHLPGLNLAPPGPFCLPFRAEWRLCSCLPTWVKSSIR